MALITDVWISVKIIWTFQKASQIFYLSKHFSSMKPTADLENLIHLLAVKARAYRPFQKQPLPIVLSELAIHNVWHLDFSGTNQDIPCVLQK